MKECLGRLTKKIHFHHVLLIIVFCIFSNPAPTHAQTEAQCPMSPKFKWATPDEQTFEVNTPINMDIVVIVCLATRVKPALFGQKQPVEIKFSVDPLPDGLFLESYPDGMTLCLEWVMDPDSQLYMLVVAIPSNWVIHTQKVGEYLLTINVALTPEGEKQTKTTKHIRTKVNQALGDRIKDLLSVVGAPIALISALLSVGVLYFNYRKAMGEAKEKVGEHPVLTATSNQALRQHPLQDENMIEQNRRSASTRRYDKAWEMTSGKAKNDGTSINLN